MVAPMLTDTHPIHNDVDEDPPGRYHSTYWWADSAHPPPCPACDGTLARANGTLEVWPVRLDAWALVCNECGETFPIEVS